MDGNNNNDILPAGITEEELEARVNAVLAERTEKVKIKQKRRIIGMAVAVAIELLIAALLIITVISSVTGQRFWFFGYSFSVVVTDSMVPEINVGDFIVIQECGIGDIQEGDNVVFVAGTEFSGGRMKGKSIVHEVERKETVDGEIRLYTKGKKTGAAPDSGYVTVNGDDSENSLFVGKHVGTSAFIGAVYGFLSNYMNWIFLIVLIIVVWFGVSQTVRIVKNTKKKRAEAASENADGNADLPDEESGEPEQEGK